VPTPHLHGIVPALVTPFREDERIDYNAWQVIVEAMIAAGVDGMFAGGSTGEFCSLEWDERLVATRFCKQVVNGRVPLYANVGCITTRDSLKLARQMEDIGVDAAVIITPFYLKPSQDELAEHFIEICHSVRIPVLLYNFPQHGGVSIAVETAARVAEKCDNLIGVKDSSGSLELAIAFRNCAPGRSLSIFVGPEKLIVPALENGCAGSVSGCANIAPQLFVSLYRAIREGNRLEAAHLQALASDLQDVVPLHTFPSVIKEAMNIAGLPAGICRKPVGPMPAAARSQLFDFLHQTGLATAHSPRTAAK